jgi:putative transposase
LQLYPRFSIGFYCRLFGKSRQAFYELQDSKNDRHLEEILILKLVSEIRAEMPRIGTKKIHFLLAEKLVEHQIKIGRDRLYTLMGEHGFLLRYRRRKPYTTNSNHRYRKYPNLIREMLLTRPNQLWVSDITYIQVGMKFAYLSIITDAYSRKIVGYCLFPTLHSEGVLNAFKQAKKDSIYTGSLIHHSDRGVQYCCSEYIVLLESYGIQISMTEKGDPYENAIAERINGILKTEFHLSKSFQSFDDAKQATDEAIRKYNEIRPHASCDYLTPSAAHKQSGKLKARWSAKKRKNV